MSDVYLSPGVRTPFLKAGGAYAGHEGLRLSVLVAQAMNARARSDFIVWGHGGWGAVGLLERV